MSDVDTMYKGFRYRVLQRGLWAFKLSRALPGDIDRDNDYIGVGEFEYGPVRTLQFNYCQVKKVLNIHKLNKLTKLTY